MKIIRFLVNLRDVYFLQFQIIYKDLEKLKEKYLFLINPNRFGAHRN